MYLVESLKVVTIADLKLEVSLHNPAWITEQDYKGSLCLKTLESQGLVRVTKKQQSRVERAPIPTKRQNRIVVSNHNIKQKPVVVEKPIRVEQREDTLIPLIQKTIAEALSQGLQNLQAAPNVVSRPQIKKETVTEDVPIFIPSGLVPEGFSNLTVEAKASITAGLDEATAALKRLRRKNE